MKAVEQDFSTQAVKKLKTNQLEDSKEKEWHYCKSPVAALGEAQSKSFVCHPLRRKSGVQCEKTNLKTDQIKCLQSFSGTIAENVRNVSAKCDAECCRNVLYHCNTLFCATEKNPFVRLEACSYINMFAKSLDSGITGSYNLGEFFHQGKHVLFYPGLRCTVQQSDVSCSTSKMQNERSPIKGGLFFKREKHQNRERWFSCCQSDNSISLRGKKRNIGRKPRNHVKVTEKSTVQNIFTGVTNECSECELQTEGTVATRSSLTASGLNLQDITQSALCGRTSDLHPGKKTCEVQKRSGWRKNDTELLAFEGDFKKTSDLPAVTKGENSDNIVHHSAALDSLGGLAQVCAVSNSHKRRPREKLNKNDKKLQLLTCQRTVPMTGKHVWPLESCARTSEWLHKKRGPVSERKIRLPADFKESSDESSVKAVGTSPVTEQLGHLDLYTSSAELNKESTSEITDANSECLTSLETSEYSHMDIYESSRMSNESVESLVNIDRRAVAFNHDDEQEVKASSDFTKKRNKKKKGAVAKRSLSVTVQVGASAGNTDRINFSRKVSVVNQTLSDLKPVKVLNTGKLMKFKIPLCRNKPKSRKLESGCSFERETCSPLEVLDSVSRKEKTDNKTFSVNAKQQPLPVVSHATSTSSMKKKANEINSEDFRQDGSENLCSGNLSNEMSTLPEHLPSYPHCFLDRAQGPSVLDFRGTEDVLKTNFPDASWNAADHSIALETDSDSKPRGNPPQHKSQIFPDILEAYKKDVLVIDVIQDDPDLFGTKNEKELALGDSESCPLEAACSGFCIKDEKQDLPLERPGSSENARSVCDHFRYASHSFYYNDPKYFPISVFWLWLPYRILLTWELILSVKI